MSLCKSLSLSALTLALCLGISPAANMSAGTAHAQPQALRLAAQPFPSYAPIFLAKKKGWLDEELARAGSPAVTLATFAAGPPINESFAAGQQDIGFLGDTPALIGRATGLETRLVGKSSVGPRSLAVVVPEGSPLHSPADLKGRKVAVTKGSYAHHLLALVLKEGGLTLSDVEVINLANGDIPAALVSGNIDAGAVWEPVITRLESRKEAHVLADGTGIKGGVLAIVASQGILKEHPEQVEAVLRAYRRGADYIRENPAAAASEVSADVGLAPDLLQKVFAKFDYNPALHDDDVAEVQKSADFMYASGLIKAPVDARAFAERDINRAAGLK